MLCLIEPDPLYAGEQIENLFLSPSTHSGGTIKGDNRCLALSSRPDISPLPSLFQHNCLWAIHYGKAPLSGAGSPTQPEVMTLTEMSDVAAVTVRQSWECMRRGAGYGILFTF